MIDENDELPGELKSATEHAEELKRFLPRLRIGCVHGKMKARDKDAVMAAFMAGDIDVLVSTTVIEVGVDIPNASLMIVENAERFGLSQLHQLRGRVGRGKYKSYCVLVSDADSEEARARLKIMANGCDLYFAETVLALRAVHPDVTLEAAVPFEGQADRWDAYQRARYNVLLSRCDRHTLLQKEHTPECMTQPIWRLSSSAVR